MRISLTSIGFKIVSICLLFCMVILFMCLVNYVDGHEWAKVFCFFVVVLCFLGLIICFTHKIIIKEEYIILRQLFPRKIPLKNIKDIQFSDQYNSNIIIFITEEKEYKIAGYSNLKGYKSQLGQTEKIVKRIINLKENHWIK